MERLVLAIGAVLRRPEMVMGTYGSDGGGGQGVSGFVSNVLFRGGAECVLFRGGAECALLRGPELELQCGSTASWVLPVRLSTAISTTAELRSSRRVVPFHERLCTRGENTRTAIPFLTLSQTPRSDLRLDEDEVDALPRVRAHQAHGGARTEGLGEDGAGVRPVRDARAHGALPLRVQFPPVRR